jgi:hypothetical protein
MNASSLPSRAVRHVGVLVIAAACSGCASFELFTPSPGGPSSPGAAAGALAGAAAFGGAVLTRAPLDGWAPALTNRSESSLRVVVSTLADGPVELRAAPVGDRTQSCGLGGGATLTLRGQSLYFVLDVGCALQVISRGTSDTPLRLQVEPARDKNSH